MSGSGSGSGSGSSSSSSDPYVNAKAIRNQLQAAIQAPYSGPTVSSQGTAFQVAPRNLNAAGIIQQNTVIKRLENDWMDAFAEGKSRRVLGQIRDSIKSHMAQYKGLTSRWLSDIEAYLADAYADPSADLTDAMIARRDAKKRGGRRTRITRRRKGKSTRRRGGKKRHT